jgi:hypothetical protein
MIHLQRMNTTSCPKAMQTWIRSHKKTVIPEIDLAVYPTQTLVWWKTNQPSCTTDLARNSVGRSYAHYKGYLP